MDKRLKEISQRLSEYSLGKFSKSLALSPRLDEIDAITSSINMLGEELRSVTISRDYFTSIFNSVSDMVFILDNRGVIEDANRAAETLLKYEPGTLIGKTINAIHKGPGSFFERIATQLTTHPSLLTSDGVLYSRAGGMIPVRLHAAYFKKESRKKWILLTATDITAQKKTENLVLRAIIDTQEKERRRLAKDLHDSLTQQLSAIKFYISTTADLARDPQQKKILVKSSEALTEIIGDMRDICFNLMPKTLQEFGLVRSVDEYCNHLLLRKKAGFTIKEKGMLPRLSSGLTIDLYRIIQEFITNALTHGKASKIGIVFSYPKKILKVVLRDNGKGFDTSRAAGGMGLQNVQSRVKSHDGELQVASAPGKGTTFTITIRKTSTI